MNKLSEKALLKIMSEFPKHELTTEKRTEMLKTFGEQRFGKKKRKLNFQRIAALAAMFVLAVIGPILYFSNEKQESKPRSASVVDGVKEAVPGEYFALIDENEKPIYGDRNYGIPNKVSLLAPQEWVAKDQRSVGKIMIFLWGDQLDWSQSLKIDGVYVKTGMKQHLGVTALGGGMYGTDAHSVTSFEAFSMPGRWNLEFTLGDKKIGEFSIYVKEPYVQVGKTTVLISQEDLYAGVYEEVNIEVVGENLPEKVELEIVNVDDEEIFTYTFQDKRDYTTTRGINISLYTGDFTLQKSGKYRFSVLGQSQIVEVRKPISN